MKARSHQTMSEISFSADGSGNITPTAVQDGTPGDSVTFSFGSSAFTVYIYYRGEADTTLLGVSSVGATAWPKTIQTAASGVYTLSTCSNGTSCEEAAVAGREIKLGGVRTNGTINVKTSFAA
jgi:predicted anti-sigma-YlaC factor YlaD